MHNFTHIWPQQNLRPQGIEQQQQESWRPHLSSCGGAQDSDPPLPVAAAYNPGDGGHGGGACHSRAPGSNASDNSHSQAPVTLGAQVAATISPPGGTSERDCGGWKVPTLYNQRQFRQKKLKTCAVVPPTEKQSKVSKHRSVQPLESK